MFFINKSEKSSKVKYFAGLEQDLEKNRRVSFVEDPKTIPSHLAAATTIAQQAQKKEIKLADLQFYIHVTDDCLPIQLADVAAAIETIRPKKIKFCQKNILTSMALK